MREERHKKVESLLKTKIDLIIRNELSDRRLGLMSITHIKVAKDFEVATVFVSHPQDEEIRQAVVDILNKASGYIEKILGRAVRLRKIPTLNFKLDDSMIYAASIDELLESIKEEEDKRNDNNDLNKPDTETTDEK
jgi:ribosome-binding factor A